MDIESVHLPAMSLWVMGILILDRAPTFLGYTPNWYSILQPPPPEPVGEFQNMMSEPTHNLVDPFSQFHQPRSGPIVKVLPETMSILSPPQDVGNLPPEIRQVFLNSAIKKTTGDTLECSNSACAVQYRPICDNMGQVYQNPCWFGYHQCVRRKEGIIIVAAGCDTLGQLGTSRDKDSDFRREPRRSPVTLRDDNEQCGDDATLGTRLARQITATFDQFAQNASRDLYMPYTADSKIVMDRMPLILGMQSISNLYEAMISSGITSVQHKKLSFRCSEDLGILETMFRVGRSAQPEPPGSPGSEDGQQLLEQILHAGSQVTIWERQPSKEWKIIIEYRIRHGK